MQKLALRPGLRESRRRADARVAALRASLDAGVPFNPTAMTSTEMNTAWNAGATFVKLFPASAVGPQFIRELQHVWLPETLSAAAEQPANPVD